MILNHFQNAYVTADLDRAIELFMNELDAPGEPFRMEASYTVTTDAGEAEATTRVAFIQAGRLQYELIEPLAGAVQIYTDALRPGQLLQFHHAGMRTDAIEAIRAEGLKHGRTIPLEGDARGVKFLYIDTRATLGHYLEYVQAPEDAWRSVAKAPR